MSNPSVKNTLLDLLFGFIRQRMQQTYYSVQESCGQHKRYLVVQHVEQTCISLEESREQFATTLDKLKTLINLPDTPLAQKYKVLKSQYELCQAKALQVDKKITAITEVTAALFQEWENELLLYQNRSLRSRSQQQLKAAKQHYARLLKSLLQAQAKIAPVLAAFHDQVLFLKHHLNAQAIAALQDEFVLIGVDISQLIAAMEKTLAQAHQFVAALGAQKALVKL